MKDEIALFKALADPTRLRLAALLSIRGETCVCYLAQAIDVPDFKISRHLGIMRSSGIVEARREGTWMYYKLRKPRSGFERRLQKGLRECMAADNTVQADLKRLGIATNPK